MRRKPVKPQMYSLKERISLTQKDSGKTIEGTLSLIDGPMIKIEGHKYFISEFEEEIEIEKGKLKVTYKN